MLGSCPPGVPVSSASDAPVRSSPPQRLGTRSFLVPKSAYIRAHRRPSDPAIRAYSCLRIPRFAIRRSAVRTRLAPLLVSGFTAGDPRISVLCLAVPFRCSFPRLVPNQDPIRAGSGAQNERSTGSRNDALDGSVQVRATAFWSAPDHPGYLRGTAAKDEGPVVLTGPSSRACRESGG
jgi:hypothetical protein